MLFAAGALLAKAINNPQLLFSITRAFLEIGTVINKPAHRKSKLCPARHASKPMSEFTELAESRFLDCDSCGMTQGAFDPICCGFAGYVHNNKNNLGAIQLHMTTLDTGRCSHATCSLVVLIALYITRSSYGCISVIRLE